VILTSCTRSSPTGVAPYIYLSGDRKIGHTFVEYYPAEQPKQYINKNVGGWHYLNSYNDGKRFYLSLAHALFIYDSESKQITELPEYASNAMKKINGDIWFVHGNGFDEGGYSSSLCKINDKLDVECLFEVKNQQITDFYIDFEQQVFFGAGLGVSSLHGGGEYKVVKYDMSTGEEKNVRNDGEEITTGRIANICPRQFIVDGDIYRDTGEKIGVVKDSAGNKLELQINDIAMNSTAFFGADKMSLEVYGCKNNETVHLKTIKLDYAPDIYPASHSSETTDDGEISMPIISDDNIFEFIGFQSVNLRTGEIQVHLFDERVYELHAVARFQSYIGSSIRKLIFCTLPSTQNFSKSTSGMEGIFLFTKMVTSAMC